MAIEASGQWPVASLARAPKAEALTLGLDLTYLGLCAYDHDFENIIKLHYKRSFQPKFKITVTYYKHDGLLVVPELHDVTFKQRKEGFFIIHWGGPAPCNVPKIYL